MCLKVWFYGFSRRATHTFRSAPGLPSPPPLWCLFLKASISESTFWCCVTLCCSVSLKHFFIYFFFKTTHAAFSWRPGWKQIAAHWFVTAEIYLMTHRDWKEKKKKCTADIYFDVCPVLSTDADPMSRSLSDQRCKGHRFIIFPGFFPRGSAWRLFECVCN